MDQANIDLENVFPSPHLIFVISLGTLFHSTFFRFSYFFSFLVPRLAIECYCVTTKATLSSVNRTTVRANQYQAILSQ